MILKAALIALMVSPVHLFKTIKDEWAGVIALVAAFGLGATFTVTTAGLMGLPDTVEAHIEWDVAAMDTLSSEVDDLYDQYGILQKTQETTNCYLRALVNGDLESAKLCGLGG